MELEKLIDNFLHTIGWKSDFAKEDAEDPMTINMVLVLVKICNQDNHNVNSVCTVIARNLAKKSIQNMARPAIVTDDMVFLAQQIIKKAFSLNNS